MTAPLDARALDAPLAMVCSAALSRVIAVRMEQISIYSHGPAQDDATGAHHLIGLARTAKLRSAIDMLREADTKAGDALDMTLGSIDRLDPRMRDILQKRLATAAALIIAASDVIDRAPAWQEPLP